MHRFWILSLNHTAMMEGTRLKVNLLLLSLNNTAMIEGTRFKVNLLLLSLVRVKMFFCACFAQVL